MIGTLVLGRTIFLFLWRIGFGDTCGSGPSYFMQSDQNGHMFTSGYGVSEAIAQFLGTYGVEQTR